MFMLMLGFTHEQCCAAVLSRRFKDQSLITEDIMIGLINRRRTRDIAQC